MPIHRFVLALACALLVAGCATRPVNPPLAKFDRGYGYRYDVRAPKDGDRGTLIVLAFSGGGTRAAAFSFGVLEELRRTPVTIDGRTRPLLDEVDVITGVSGGSFTALAFGLYGDRLFDEYESRFLKRNVQRELLLRTLSPSHWPALYSEGYGRSEMASELYDEILFGNATFADLLAKPGPLVVANATDISTGSRVSFTQEFFDILCSDIATVKLSRAAAASSAVPIVLSPVTINNYGGSCGYREPSWMRRLLDGNADEVRPAGRAIQRLHEVRAFQDSANRPFLHLVDGGISDNLGLRTVIESFEQIEASAGYRRALHTEQLKRIVVFVVNSLSVPRVDWDRRERAPNDLQILLKATGVPIDRYSYEGIELLKDIVARWQALRRLEAAGAAGADAMLAQRAAGIPDVELYAIDVSIQNHPNAAEREFLNETPTSFVLTDEQVDRLRKAAGTIMRQSPDFRRLVRALGGVPLPAGD